MDTLEEVLEKLDSIKDSLIDYDIWKLIITNSDPMLYCLLRLVLITDQELIKIVKKREPEKNISSMLRHCLMDTYDPEEGTICFEHCLIGRSSLSTVDSITDLIGINPNVKTPEYRKQFIESGEEDIIMHNSIFYTNSKGNVFCIMEVYENSFGDLYDCPICLQEGKTLS